MPKLLFLGNVKKADDPRILYRQVQKLSQYQPEVQCLYVGLSSFDQEDQLFDKLKVLRLRKPYGKRGKRLRMLPLVRLSISLQPDWVQAPHPADLPWAVLVRCFTKAKIIYDSREDYFNQAYEYAGKTCRGLLKGIQHRLVELLLARFCEVVFCTDPYLYNLYRKKVFDINQVHLLRNFVNSQFIDGRATPPDLKGPLKLVYIGSVNEYRGVIECANFVRKFNRIENRQVLAFDVYGPENGVVRRLKEEGLIYYKGEVSHPEVLSVLKEYHVGVCLWQNIKKFERNLPIKNFEYMAVGLPVLTSNLGNLKTYITRAKSGICINPSSYEEFREAIYSFMDTNNWKAFSKNGMNAGDKLSLDKEIQPYVQMFQSK